MARGVKKDGPPQMSLKDKICVGAAELIGTGLLVFIGCMGCMKSMVLDGIIPHVQISFTFGLAVMFIIQMFGHISGAHLNPAVTLTSVVLGYTPYIMAVIYVASQLIGALLGFALLKAVTPARLFDAENATAHGVCSTIPSSDISSLQALVVEIMLTLCLVLVCCAVWDHRNTHLHDSLSIRFGLTIAGLAMAGGPYTGASMNPARSFGPAVINNDWSQHWIYWVGPLLAAAVGAGGYRALFSRPKPEVDHNELEDIPLNITNHEKSNAN